MKVVSLDGYILGEVSPASQEVKFAQKRTASKHSQESIRLSVLSVERN